MITNYKHCEDTKRDYTTVYISIPFLPGVTLPEIKPLRQGVNASLLL